MARPTQYTEPHAAKLLEGLTASMTRTAAAGLMGVDDSTGLRWLARFAGFAAQVAHAEHEAEARHPSVIAKAAFGHDVVKRTTTTKAEGTVEERIETHHECEWRAALEWLKRRRRKDWGDTVHVNVDEEITKLLAELADRGTPHSARQPHSRLSPEGVSP